MSSFPSGVASVLFDNQVRVLWDIIQQESDDVSLPYFMLTYVWLNI